MRLVIAGAEVGGELAVADAAETGGGVENRWPAATQTQDARIGGQARHVEARREWNGGDIEAPIAAALARADRSAGGRHMGAGGFRQAGHERATARAARHFTAIHQQAAVVRQRRTDLLQAISLPRQAR